MTPKNTPSGRALEWFDGFIKGWKPLCGPQEFEHFKNIRTALLRSHAIESGDEVLQDAPDKDPLVVYGHNSCLERLKGIGHDTDR